MDGPKSWWGRVDAPADFRLAEECREGKIRACLKCNCRSFPLVPHHEVSDLASFRLFTTQLIVNGTATQSQIVKAFGVPMTTVKRCCRLYRERGSAAFFKPAARRQGHRLTPERLVEVQALLDEGRSVPEISRQTGLLASTLHKAIDHGRLKQFKKKIPPVQARL